MAAFNYRDLIRLIPVADWLEYSASRNFEIKQSQSWAEVDETVKQTDIKAAIESLEGAQREAVYKELRQVYAMANPNGVYALKNAVPEWDGVLKLWEEMVSDAQRVLDALMNRAGVLQRAQAILQADAQIGRRVRMRLMLPEGPAMSTESEQISALEQAISEKFTQPKARKRACEIDVLKRHLDGSTQLDIRLEADHQRNLEFADDNRTHWRNVRPTKPMTVIYHPVAGVLDLLVPGGKKVREKLLPLLGEHLFDGALEAQEQLEPLLLLNRLLQGLTPPSDSGLDLMSYGVTGIGLTHCRLRAPTEPAMDIELRTKPKGADVLQGIQNRGLASIIGRGYTVDQATVSLYFATAAGKERVLHMQLRPSGINNRADLEERDLRLCEQLLKALSVMEQLPEDQIDDEELVEETVEAL